MDNKTIRVCAHTTFGLQGSNVLCIFCRIKVLVLCHFLENGPFLLYAQINEPYPSATYVTKMFPFQWSQVSVRW